LFGDEMMKFLNTTHCTISTLSPVHIGCGEDYYPTNYVIDDRFLHHFSEEGLIAALTKAEKDRLKEISEAQNKDSLKNLQAFIYDKKDKLQNYATHSVPLSEELETFYLSRIGKVSQRESGGKNVQNQLNIARHAFNPYNQTPYFAGSSIKGAIRTALLNALNEGTLLQTKLDELKIKDKFGKAVIVSDKYDVPKNAGNELQKNLFGYQAISDDLKKGIKGDPLRLLKIGDATYSHADNLHASEIRFAVSRKNWKSEYKSTAENKGLYQLLECLPAHRSRALTFDLTFLENRFSVRDICLACNEFFVPQLEKELEMLQSLNFCNQAWAQGLKKLLVNELTDAFREHKAFLLRVGQHGGAESNTLDGVRHIKIMQGKGNAPKYLDKPTTVWLTANHKDQQHDLLPFGWVLVEIGDFKFEKTHDFLKANAANDYALHTRLQKLTTQREEFFITEQEKREIQAQQEREAIEKERLRIEAEEKRATQLAEMTEEQKLIFELQADFDADPTCQANGVLNQKLVGVIKQAATWSTDDKKELLALGLRVNEKWKSKKLKEWLKTLQ
jgi:CRISPR-associated protein Csm5